MIELFEKLIEIPVVIHEECNIGQTLIRCHCREFYHMIKNFQKLHHTDLLYYFRM